MTKQKKDRDETGKFIKGKPGGPGRNPKYDNEDDLKDAIDKYFKKCDARTRTILDKNGNVFEAPDPEPYTVMGLCLTLGIDRDTLNNYSKEDLFFGTIKEAKSRVAQDIERRLMETKNQAGAMFNLKNNFGWNDRQELDHTSSDGSMKLGDKISLYLDQTMPKKNKKD